MRPARRSSLSKTTPLQKGCGSIFFGIFLFVGLAAFALIAFQLGAMVRTFSWNETPCTIVEANRHPSRGFVIRYRYSARGRHFTSDQFTAGMKQSLKSREINALLARYPANSETVCYVNPSDSSQAVLQHGSPWMLLWIFFPLIFVAVGGFGLRSIWQRKRRPSNSGLPEVPSLGSLPMQLVLPGAETVGPVVLKPATSPIGKLVTAVLFALIWNGLTSVFVTMAVKSWLHHKPEYLLTIFITPFVLVGLVLVAACVGAFLNLFNPRIVLTVSSQSVPLGGTLDLSWTFTGAAWRIRGLRIVIEGREEATYKRGTSTSTDSHSFVELAIAATDDTALIREGNARLEIPKNLMHSWSGGSNKIVWELKVRGDVPRYPDVSEDFPFTVLPASR